MRLVHVAVTLIVVSATAPSTAAQPETSGILVSAPVLSLAHDAGLGERPERLAEPTTAGPRGRGAWRGAKRGLLVGLGISAVAVAGTMVHDAQDGGCDIFCPWMFVAAAAVPFTALATATGAVIGSATARPEAIPPPVLEVP